MRIKSRLEKLEGRQSEKGLKGLADRLAHARLNRIPNPPRNRSELEAIAARKPESMAARLARGKLRIMAYEKYLEVESTH